MLLKQLATLLFCLSFPALSQSAPIAPEPASRVSGSTMQETNDFISDLNEKQGRIQHAYTGDSSMVTVASTSIKLAGACSISVRSRNAMYARDVYFISSTTLLDLARSEPTSVAIKRVEDTTPQIYSLTVEHAYRKLLSKNESIDNNPAIPIPPGTDISNETIKSNNGISLTLVTQDGRLMIYTPGKKVKLETMPQRQGRNTPATLSDFAVGNVICIRAKQLLNAGLRPSVASENGYGLVEILSITD